MSCSKQYDKYDKYDDTEETDSIDSIDSELFNESSDDEESEAYTEIVNDLPYELQALECILSEDFKQEIIVLDKALEINPANEFALEFRGLAHYSLNNHEQALKDFNKALEINPASEFALKYRGVVHYMLDNYDQALADLNKALEIDPENAFTLEYRGAVYIMLNNFDQALADLNKALEINPESEFALKYRGTVHYNLNNYDKALIDLNKALEINKSLDTDPQFVEILSAVYYALNNYNKYDKYQKLYTYNQILNIDPKNVPALICRSNVYQMLDNNDKALIDINSVLEIDQDNVNALGIRNIIYQNLKNYERALADLNRALEIDPENASSLEHRGRVYQMLGNYDDALVNLNKSIEIEPECQFALGYRGNLHRLLGNYKESLADLDKCLTIDPDNAFALANRGEVYRELSNYDKALSDLNEALKIDPEEVLALTARGSVYKHLKKYDQALVDLNMALKIDQESAIVFAVRGEVYKLLNNYDQAKADLDKALEIEPHNVFALTTRGKVYELLENYDQAKADFDRALEINPDSVSALAARAHINRILYNHECELVDLNRTLEIDQQNKPALIIRGDIYKRLGKYKLAIADFDKALNIDSKDNKLDEFILISRSIVLSLLKDYDKALIDLNRAMKINPGVALLDNGLRQMLKEALVDLYKIDSEDSEDSEDSSVFIFRAHICRMIGNYEEALNDIENVPYSDQNYSHALKIRDELIEMRKTDHENTIRKKTFDQINDTFRAAADSHRYLNVSTTNFRPCSKCIKSENSFEYCKVCLDRINRETLEETLGLTLAMAKEYSCPQCKRIIMTPNWCSICDRERLENDFSNWTSGNQQVDEFIRELQLYVKDYQGDVIEWIPYTKFDNIKKIGSGGFAKVFKADWLDGKIEKWNYDMKQWERAGKMCVALKVVENSKNSKDKINELLNEARGYVECRRTILERNIIRIYGFSQDPSTKDYIIVMQYMEGGDLRSFLSRRKDLDWNEKLSILSKIAHGLITMHYFISLIHGDLHSGNIFFNKDDDVFIADLGLCLHASQEFKPKQGFAIRYTAPEILHGGTNTKESDIYSFGMIMFEILTGEIPFPDYGDEELKDSICQGIRPKYSQNIPIAFTVLMEKCWDNDPGKRPDAKRIDDWFEDIKKAVKLHSMSLTEREQYENEHKNENFELKGFETISDYIAENFLSCNAMDVYIPITPVTSSPQRLVTPPKEYTIKH